jgi:hypothetical protein
MKLTNGESYTLVELFQADRRIVIPDLQRDYCWGDKKGKDVGKTLAEAFMLSLLEMREIALPGATESVSLGLIYAYERPRNFVNIADGQQRLTSVYLLLCMIYRKLIDSGENVERLRSFLVLQTSKEPRLQFEIRESTRYFLGSFLRHAVLKEKGGISDFSINSIESSAWFRTSYGNDPSVKSMLQAIEVFWKYEGLTTHEFHSFADFLLGFGDGCIRFVYFDFYDRSLGEQLYVIINSRGAPMEPSEHIKPVLLGAIEENVTREEWAIKWEKWQDFFWRHKTQKEPSSDDGFEEFLKAYVRLRVRTDRIEVYSYFSQKNDKEKLAELTELESLFTQLKILTEEYLKEGCFLAIVAQLIQPGESTLRDLKESDVIYIVLPLLAFMVKRSGDKRSHYHFLRRLRKNRFDGLEGLYKYRKQHHVHWGAILAMVERSVDLTELLRFDEARLGDTVTKLSGAEPWFGCEEQIKDLLFPERYIWEPTSNHPLSLWEDHRDFVGYITPLLQAFQISKRRNEVATASLMHSNELLEFYKLQDRAEVINKISEVFDRYASLERMFDSLHNAEPNHKDQDANSSRLHNFYLLFQVLIKRFPIGHRNQVNSGGDDGKYAIGFDERTHQHFSEPDFFQFLTSDHPLTFVECWIRKYFSERWNSIEPAHRTLTLWVFFKVLLAEEGYLGLKDAIAARHSMALNRLIDLQEANLCNFYCGRPVGKKPYFQRAGLEAILPLDSPLCTLNSIVDEDWLRDRNGRDIDEERRQKLKDRLREGDVVLRERLRSFFGDSYEATIDGFYRHLQG